MNSNHKPPLLSRLWVRILLAMMLLIGLTIGSISLVDQYVTGVHFSHFEQRRAMRAKRRIAKALTIYYAHHGTFSGSEGLFQQLVSLHGGHLLLVNTDHIVIESPSGQTIGQHIPKLGPHLALKHQGRVIGYLLWNPGPGRPSIAPPKALHAIQQRFLADVGQSVWLIGAITILIAFILSLAITRRITGPIERLTTAARNMAEGDLSQRVALTGQDEISRLAQAFNTLGNNLSKQKELRENLTRDVAHELRHPLSHIQGYLEAMMDGLMPTSPDNLNLLFQELSHLNQIVEDLQLLDQAEAGSLPLHRESTDLLPLIEHAIAVARPDAEKDGIHLQHVAEKVPTLYLDEQRTLQILSNLLRNAIQYTARGGTITVSLKTGIGHVELAVSDTGQGIATSDLPHIFSRFYRGDAARSRATGGHGLGLSIVKQFVERQGGTITVESKLNQGSTFRIFFPIAPTSLISSS